MSLGYIGNFTLFIAAIISIYGSFFLSNKNFSQRLNLLALSLFISLFLSFSTLIYAYVVSDFSVLNVALNSHISKPLIYKISGAWANHEGSMLLFVFLLSVFTFLFSYRNKNSEFKKLIIKSQNTIILLFLVYILFASNPFIVLENPPENGQGLNPLLQDIGLALHPPLLYIGYCGFSLALSFAVASLWQREIKKSHAETIRNWLLTSWGFLTLGIGLGSWWAYRELGWGGFWFWDPVENSSLLPWLTATALIHSIIVTQKRGTLKGWTCLLSILTFSFCIIGFFLVRSGVLTSVHSFASDPGRGVFLLLIITTITGGSLILYSLRSIDLYRESEFSAHSKEAYLLLNNIFMLTLCGTVFLGTIYPVISQIVLDKNLSVGSPYFNTVFNPIAIIALFFAAIAPSIKWESDSFRKSILRFKYSAVLTLIITAIIILVFNSLSIIEHSAIFIAIWLIINSLHSFYLKISKIGCDISLLSMEIAHIGAGLICISIAFAVGLYEERTTVIKKGEEIQFTDYFIKYNGEKIIKSDNYVARKAEFFIKNSDNSSSYRALYPEVRYFPVEKNRTTESALLTNYLSDIYIVIGDIVDNDSTTIRIYYRPMINGIWLGCILIASGGFLFVLRRRKV